MVVLATAIASMVDWIMGAGGSANLTCRGAARKDSEALGMAMGGSNSRPGKGGTATSGRRVSKPSIFIFGTLTGSRGGAASDHDHSEAPGCQAWLISPPRGDVTAGRRVR